MMRKYLISFIAGIAILSACGYLLYCSISGGIGYPLDDAWIHQTFARNIISRGEWSVNPGEVTSGSTSPLWTLLLSIGYVLRIPNILWTNLLGVMSLAANIWLIVLYASNREMKWSAKIGLILILVGLEWHLVWSAVSGMEILLYSGIGLAILFELTISQPRWWLVGLLAGVLIWVRPDGITLAGPILVTLVIRWITGDRKTTPWIAAITPLGLIMAAYLAFNYFISGSIWPNTFSAKQVEYAILQEAPFVERILKTLLVPFTGASIFLIPGIIRWGEACFAEKRWVDWVLPAWVIGFLCLYAWRLPVTYQHGRYLIPVIPVILAIGFRGYRGYRLPGIEIRWKYVVSRVFWAGFILTTVGFYWLGMQAFEKDVRIIETEMVGTAQWIRENTPADSLIAAHDIGALGYFGERKILDLAGLINPEIIPLMQNSQLISDYITRKNAEYLVIFPSWYNPPLEIKGDVVFPVETLDSTIAGTEKMTIYKLEK